jgi:hypothetical protein
MLRSLVSILKQITTIQLDTYYKLVSLYSHTTLNLSFPSDVYIPKKTLIANLSEARNFATSHFKQLNQKCLQLQLEIDEFAPYALPERFLAKNLEETLKVCEQITNLDMQYLEKLESRKLINYCNSLCSYICTEDIEEDLLDMLNTFTLKQMKKMHEEFYNVHKSMLHNLKKQSQYYALLSSKERNRLLDIANDCKQMKEETKSELTDISIRMLSMNNSLEEATILHRNTLLSDVEWLLSTMMKLSRMILGEKDPVEENICEQAYKQLKEKYLYTGFWLIGIGLVKDIA